MEAPLSSMMPDSRRPYTKSKAPWLLGENRDAKGETSDGVKFGWKLFHYLSGGGLRDFGRTVKQEEADIRRTRFLVAMAVFAVVWFWMWI